MSNATHTDTNSHNAGARAARRNRPRERPLAFEDDAESACANFLFRTNFLSV